MTAVSEPDELTLSIRDRLRTDAGTLSAYVSDASIFRRVPQAVFEPRNVQDITEAVELARQNDWPVTIRGGGTSVAGNAIGEGLIIDTSRHMNRILDIDPIERTATVEPGVICDQLRDAAAPHGLTYGPDPSTHSRCTVAGMIANNACGSHSVAWGTAADSVVELTVLTATGEVVTLRQGGTSSPALDAQLKRLVDENLALFRTELGQFPRQVSGYGLHYLLPENGFDPAKAFAGSEGTLGLILQAKVKLVELPAVKRLVVLAFRDVFAAAAAAPRTLIRGIATSEGMGGDLLDALRLSQGEHAGADLPGQAGHAGGWLYCEATGPTADEAEAVAARLVEQFDDDDALVAHVVAHDPATMGRLWKIREAAAGIVTRLPDGGEAWPNWEDSAVPPKNLAGYLRDLYALLDRYQLRGIPFGHFGEGCVHIRISFDFFSDQGVQTFKNFMHDAAQTVARHGGSLSGEHGDGRARSALLPLMYSAGALKAFGQAKRIFDPVSSEFPAGVLNPGVLVDPDPVDQGVRPGSQQLSKAFIPLHALSRDRRDDGSNPLVNAVNRCVGVGLCRSQDDAMCPSFQITGDEVHSTRGRARVLSEMFRGETLPEGTGSQQVKDALDLCLSCRACASECPVNVDMATYKSEFLHQHYQKKFRPLAHYSMGWLPWTSRWLHKVPGLASLVNAVTSIRPLEKLLMKLAGVDSTRSMIRFAPRSFSSLWKRREKHALPDQGQANVTGTDAPAQRIVLWPDSFTNHLDTQVAVDATVVLERLGYQVIVPQDFVCCGLTWHSTGQLTQAQKVLRQTTRAMKPYLDGVTPIVVLEPSCAAMLADEAPELVSDEPALATLASQVVSIGDVVARHTMDEDWPFDDLDTVALSQVHCHERSRNAHGATARVLDRMGVKEDTIETGCCGLAGNWGFEPGHGELSEQLAERELFPRLRALDDESFMLADGYSCRTQIQQGKSNQKQAPTTGSFNHDGVHLAQLLRRALKEK